MKRTKYRTLELVAVGEVEGGLLAWLAGELESELAVQARCGRSFGARPEWIDPESGCYRADRLLDSLLSWRDARAPEPGALWTLALVDHALCGASRTTVFGEATVGGCCALVSLAALRPRAGADVPVEGLFRNRLLKEAVHELGHVAGLDHCDEPACVMFPSPGLQATDRKGSGFCTRCAGRLAGELLTRA